MDIRLPANTPLPDRLRAFADYLDQRLERFDSLVSEAGERQDYDSRARLKSERAELTAIRLQFRRLFERDL